MGPTRFPSNLPEDQSDRSLDLQNLSAIGLAIVKNLRKRKACSDILTTINPLRAHLVCLVSPDDHLPHLVAYRYSVSLFQGVLALYFYL